MNEFIDYKEIQVSKLKDSFMISADFAGEFNAETKYTPYNSYVSYGFSINANK